MSQPDYYEIFGVSPLAGPEEIRAAHRELVKRYHPDIYWTSEDKIRATEKLRAVNEAYAVLGNAERRKEYDASRAAAARSAEPVARERTAPQRPARQRPARRARAPNVSPTNVPPWSIQVRETLQSAKKFFTFLRLAGAGAGLTLIVAAAYSLTRPPQITPAWILLEKTEVEPAASGPRGAKKGWEQVGSYGLRAACVENLKTRVRLDQQEGSQAVFDEVNGTVAITVLLTKGDAPLKAKEPLSGPEKIVKRVRHYECRAVPIRQPDSWLRRQLRGTGLIS
jgi:DnaJ domain